MLQGHADAQCNLGLMYQRGEGVGRASEAVALAWYGSAARQGHRDAAFNLGALYERGAGAVRQSNASALRFFRQAAEQVRGEAPLLGACCLLLASVRAGLCAGPA